jgi:hypothetical protein
MDILFFLLILLAIAVAAPLFGTDSRGLGDHTWETPWERLPRT